MKKQILLLTMVVLLMCIFPAAASAVTWTFGFRNNTPVEANDLHVYVYQDASLTIPLTVNNAAVNSPSDWTANFSGNRIDMSGTSLASTSSPAGSLGTSDTAGYVKFRFNTIDTTAVFTEGFWTKDGELIGDAGVPDVFESNVPLEVIARVPRSLKLTLANKLDFGLTRPGQLHTRSISATVESNDDWDLYVGGEDIFPFRSMFPSMLSVGTSLNGQMFGVSSANQAILVARERDWQVDSFFDVFFELDVPVGTRPGAYKMLLNFNAVQNY